eukprot:TRINITY_DN32771_c0_g1_i1.p2 TRINITY_DN32771_c0_g1~~TRINITY_DN32771_c0_g1_i1.p2  ORF type:complete len:191 (+),score=66.98 TRINITY_DN32771_c0_g1_i1:46-573(+)
MLRSLVGSEMCIRDRWGSKHTCHDAMMAPVLLQRWIAAKQPLLGVCHVGLVSSATHMPRVKHLFGKVFKAMNQAVRSGRPVWCHADAEHFTSETMHQVKFGVEWDGGGPGVPCDCVLLVEFVEVADPVEEQEYSERVARERAALEELEQRPYGVWKEWLDQNHDLLNAVPRDGLA